MSWNNLPTFVILQVASVGKLKVPKQEGGRAAVTRKVRTNGLYGYKYVWRHLHFPLQGKAHKVFSFQFVSLQCSTAISAMAFPKVASEVLSGACSL